VKDEDTHTFPVENVSWEDAVAFCRKLSEMPEEELCGRVYRLPTEAEWEYSCRGGASSSTLFSFGHSLSSTQANINGRFNYGFLDRTVAAGSYSRPQRYPRLLPPGIYLDRTTTAGSFPANAFALHDMHGNVWEWCQDWYAEDYYANSPRLDPQGPSPGARRVMRGGSWDQSGWHARSTMRNTVAPDYRNDQIGFRVALTVAYKATESCRPAR
jgi:formylglycine-generating enzyme